MYVSLGYVLAIEQLPSFGVHYWASSDHTIQKVTSARTKVSGILTATSILTLADVSKDLGLIYLARHTPSCLILTTMHCQLWRLVVTLILVILAQADYIMDDRNRTINYVGTWNQTLNSIEPYKVFDGTV